MVDYYLVLLVGIVMAAGSIFLFITMVKDRIFPFLRILKTLGLFVVGIGLLVFTVPDLKSIVAKDYDKLEGKCTIDTAKSGRHHTTKTYFDMVYLDEKIMSKGKPELPAYGEANPYYCEITVSKNHQFEMDYKVYDWKTRELLETSD